MSASIPPSAALETREFTLAPETVARYPEPTVMVYGTREGGLYQRVAEAFERGGYTPIGPDGDYLLKMAGGFSIGPVPIAGDEEIERLRESKRVSPRASDNKWARELSKIWINMILLENHKRSKSGRAFIPMIFCLDRDEGPHPEAMSPEEILRYVSSEDRRARRGRVYVSGSEIRRIAKLFSHPDPRIRDVAQRSIQFAKVVLRGDSILLEDREPPFRHPSWPGLLRKRNEDRRADEEYVSELYGIEDHERWSRDLIEKFDEVDRGPALPGSDSADRSLSGLGIR